MYISERISMTLDSCIFLNIHWKDWCWRSNTLATWCEELTQWKRPWCWERLRAEGEGGDRGWDGWMASPTQWTWVWANSSRWWRTTYSKSTKIINLRFVISGNLLSRCTFDHMDFLSTMTHTYTGSSPVSLEQFLRATERLSPELQSLVRPWVKHNSHLLHCVFFFFFSWQHHLKDVPTNWNPRLKTQMTAALTNLFPSNRTPLPHLLPLITTQGQYFQSHAFHSFSYLLNIFSALLAQRKQGWLLCTAS